MDNNTVEHYVTLFDASFVHQGLALYHSLLNLNEEFCLWILCIDNKCYDDLLRIGLPRVRLLKLSNYETDKLLDIKESRSRAEYCWTLTPWSLFWVFKADPLIRRLTYIDADIYFLKSPKSIFADFSQDQKSFLITGHSYAPEYDRSLSNGRYCVQFVSVKRHAGETVLHWWRDKCIEWCFDRCENGLYGDQGYFEMMPSLFPSHIYVIDSDPRLLAPWNFSYYRYSDAVLFHFHDFRIIGKRFLLLGRYPIPDPVWQNIYIPYIRAIRHNSIRYALPMGCQKKLSIKVFLMILLGTVSGIYRKIKVLSRYCENYFVDIN